jgi:ribose-phosphate pyrophosphokinase
MIITSCGNSEKMAKKMAKELKAKFVPLTISEFPDGDIYLKYDKSSFKNEKVVIVSSFQPHPDMTLFDTIFAAETARDLGAKKIILVAPYLAYMRQDKRFNEGECVSSKVMAKLLNNSIDELITIDPHIHRYKSLKDIFKIKTVKLTANHLIADYIKKHFKNEIIVGPDWESFQWAEHIAKQINIQATILKKERFSARKVEVKTTDNVSLKGKNVIIVDDIISTGNTVIKAAKKAKQLGAKNVSVIAVHGLFVENALPKLTKNLNKVITTNTIEHKTNKIDVLPLLIKALK